MPSSASCRIRGHQPDRGDGDPAGGHAEPVGCRVGEAAYGADDGLVVGHRLAHAHEHHVGDPARSAGDLAAGQGPGAGDDLLDDLGGGHVALQAALAGGAERAGHAAAGLAGDAHRHPVGIAHQHRLDERPVEELPQGLAGGAPVGLQGAQRASSGRAAGSRPARRAGRRGGRSSRRGRRPAGRSSGSRAAGPGSREGRALEPCLALLRGEVGEVARRLAATAGLVEDQGKGLDGFTHNRAILPSHPCVIRIGGCGNPEV